MMLPTSDELSAKLRFGERFDPDDPSVRLIEIRLPILPGTEEAFRRIYPYEKAGKVEVGGALMTFCASMLEGAGFINHKQLKSVCKAFGTEEPK